MTNLVIDGSRSEGVRHFGPLFDTGHLPAGLREVADPFVVCARAAIDALPDGRELEWALRHLLEAKDCAVRARVGADGASPGLPPATSSAPVVGEVIREVRERRPEEFGGPVVLPTTAAEDRTRLGDGA